LMEKLGTTKSGVQGIFTIAALANLIGSALVGKIMAKFSMRKTMPIYAIILSGGIYLWSLCDSISMYYLVAFMVGLGASGIAVVPCGALMNNWFSQKKGVAVGLAFSGSVVGGAILIQITSYMLAHYNLQMTYTVLGIITAAISIPVTIFIIREHPRDMGLAPMGVASQAGGSSLRGISLKKYIKTGSFWLLAISIFLVSFINIGLQNNISLYLTTAKNYTLADTANIITVMFVVSIFGKVILGYIYDKFGITFGALYGLVFLIISIAFFINASPEVVVFGIMFAALFALVNSMTTVAPPFVTASIVGVKHYATIFGIMNLFYGIGLVTGPQLVAKLSESFGSYTTVWMMLGGLGFIFAASTILAANKGKGFSQIAEA